MEKDIENVKKDLVTVKADVKMLQTDIAAINTKMDMVVRFFTGWRIWAVFLIFIASVALAGQRLIEMVTKVPLQ